MLSENKLIELIHAVGKLKWDIIGLCEVRRGEETIEEYEDFILYHTAATKGRNGVGFIIRKYLKVNIQSFKSYTDRIATLEVKLPKGTSWTIIQAYAPTESTNDEEMDVFYNALEGALELASNKNVLVMGDFNAQIGKIKQGEERVFGRYSHGKRSAHGQKLIRFALENNLKFTNSMFKIKPHKKWTWRSPDGKTLNEIDYIMTNKASSVKDFDIINTLNFDTDHRMIRCKLDSQRLRKIMTQENKNYTRNLAKVTREDGKIWENKFMDSVSKSTEVQSQYDNFLLEMDSFIKEIPKTKKEKRNLLTTETLQLLEERNQLYKMKRTRDVKWKITELSKKINRSISNQIKKKRQETFESFIEKAGAVKKAYKALINKKEWTANLKNKTGTSLIRRPDILEEATNFYTELYASNDISPTHSELSKNTFINSDPEPVILLSEIRHAIDTQKNDKTPGEDNVTNELLKSLSETLQRPLQRLFNTILNTGETPSQWSKSTIILLHKKGDKSDLGNYRPISLMSNIYKIFSKIILNRLTKTLDEHQPREQAGFRKSYSTTDHIQVITQIVEKANEYNKMVYMCFIDYAKAFDSLVHSAIWRALAKQGVNEKYIQLIQNIYSKCCAKIKLEKEGKEFPIRRGVRQGDPLSPKIFCAVLESIFQNLNWSGKGLNIDGEMLSHLRFADDIIIISDDPTELECMVNELAKESEKVGLAINSSKTKIITNGPKQDIVVGGEKIEYVNKFVYLGQSISFDNNVENEVQRRIALAWKKYWSFREIMKNKQVNIRVKKKLYDSAILPCLTYGSQTWSLKIEEEEELRICQRKMERSMLGIRIKDKIRNKKIRKITKLADVVKRIRQLKWKWAGHVCRMENSRWTKKVIEWIPRDGRRSRGRPRKRWQDIFAQRCGQDWMRKARNRHLWKELGEAYAEEATTT